MSPSNTGAPQRPPRPHRQPQRPIPVRWPVGEPAAALTLTANAGVLLEWQGHKLLIDGLHEGGGQFSAVPAAVQADIAAGRPPFDGIEGLMFTHLHADHFSAGQVQHFLGNFPEVPLFLPAEGPGEEPAARALRRYLAGRAAPGYELKSPEWQAVRYPLYPGLEVTAFYARHEGAVYRDVRHYCLMLSLGGRHILFLGDALQDPGYFSKMLRDTTVDTAVTNPLFLNGPAGRETLLRAIRPGKIVVDHIPFAWEDGRRFREMVARSVIRWQGLLPPVSVLWDPLDVILI